MYRVHSHFPAAPLGSANHLFSLLRPIPSHPHAVNYQLHSFTSNTNRGSLAKYSHFPAAPLGTKHLFSPLRPIPSLAANYQLHNFTTNTSGGSLAKSFDAYLRLIRFDKPTGTWLLFLPYAWGVALAAEAGSLPDWKIMLLLGTCAFAGRSGGCIMNDYWDQDFDRQVERCKTRPIASGEVSNFQALSYLALNGSVIVALFASLNTYSSTLALSSLSFLVAYPLFKRITHWPQVVLGCAFSWGVLVGYSAVKGYCDWSVVLPLFASGVMWTLIYDTIYAFQDIKDDVKAGVKSTTMLFGDNSKMILGGFSVCMMSGILATGMMSDQTWPYYTAAGLVGAHLAWQVGTMKMDNPADCMAKFKANTWLGLLLLAGIMTGTLYKKKQHDDVNKNNSK
ncbi:4-hydroxybenzoate polyprenyltransferase, mitochondrial-like [Dysidea avara]|uniref:4-hydroxybenzoate polyprenyltransferase, mitochondrial-like n=1 Tax=Dysidea avara TaxID=196820 RepID=UPI0033178796